MKSMMEATHQYICSAWKKAIRHKDNRRDFPLLYDFIPPCVDGELTDLYYWDTYFTNKGLYLDGFSDFALNNIENLKFCLNTFGCVPNMCRANGADYASQPPLLIFMVDDYYEYSADLSFLEKTYPYLLKEYAFWEAQRKCSNGLNHYGTNQKGVPENIFEEMQEYAKRCHADLSCMTETELLALRNHKTAEGESGEDHTPRFFNRAMDIVPVDLNAYLYGFEKLMAKFAKILKTGDSEKWEEYANLRKTRIEKYCYDEDSGVFFDYNVKEGKKTYVFCAACYVPFVMGISESKDGVRAVNEKLLCEHGVTSCEWKDVGEEVFQWGYPNMWAPHNYWAYVANMRVGLVSVARDIARKYLYTISDVFRKTGKIFEKYDATTGDKTIFNEYGLPEMLGWTAGIYEVFYNVVNNDKTNNEGESIG